MEFVPEFQGEPDALELDLDDLADDLREYGEDESGRPGIPAGGDSPELEKTQSRLTPGKAVREICTGLSTGALGVLFCLAYALLPMTGIGQVGYYPALVLMALTASVLGGLYYTARGSVPFGVVGPDAAGGAGLFILALALNGTGGGVSLPTLAVTLMATALLAAVLCFLLSRYQDGDWVRFVPFQVVGGVLAALGVFLLQAAYLFCTGTPLTFGVFWDLLQPGSLVSAYETGTYWAWLPAFGVGWLLFAGFHRLRSGWTLLLPLLAVSAWCFLVPAYAPDLPERFATCGRLPGFGLEDLRLLHDLFFLQSVHWATVLEQQSLILAVGVLVFLASAHKIMRLEEERGETVSLGAELRTVGAANLISALAVGFPVSLTQGRSAANASAGRIAGLSATLVCLAALLFGGMLPLLLPVFLPAGLVVFFGFSLIKRWLGDTLGSDLQPGEYLSMLLVFALTLFLGFAPGVVAGTILALVVGLARHSASGSVKQAVSGSALHSNVDRSSTQAEALRDLGEGIYILRLQGYVSPGALSSAFRLVRERLDDVAQPLLRCVILDFTSIRSIGSGLDEGLRALQHKGLERHFDVILTNIPFVLEERLERQGLAGEGVQGGFRLFRNLDYALEWCEDMLLAEAGLLHTEALSLQELLRPVFPDPKTLPYLMRVLQRRELKKNEYAIRQGAESDDMYFVESGRLTVELEVPGGKTVRLKKMGPGSVFGEMGIYTKAPRSASVRASERCVVYRLSRRRLEMLLERLPRLATSLDRFLVTLLARRVADSHAIVRELMR
ncbi:MAG: cyclic nucleotide-binding domain-containing protein [Desulfovibrionaceae bacterium]